MASYKSHLKAVWSVTFSQKGFYFASGGSDSVIFIWSTNDSVPVMCLTGHKSDVTKLEFTENLNYLLSVSRDRSCRLWNLDDGSIVRILFFDQQITSVKMNLNGDLLIAGGDLGKIYIWDLIKPELIDTFYLGSFETRKNSEIKNKSSKFCVNNQEKIRSIRFSLDERFVVVCNKTKIAYYPTLYLRSMKSKSVYGNLNLKMEGASEKLEKQGSIIKETNLFTDPEWDVHMTIFNQRNQMISVCKKKRGILLWNNLI